MRKIVNKKIAAVALGAVALTGTGVAYAYWTTSGEGTGAGSTAAGDDTAFSVAGDVPGSLFPGDAARQVTATVTNDGTENYKVQLLEAYVTTDKGALCDGSNYLINGDAAPSTADTAVSLDITAIDLEPAATQTKAFTFQFNNKPTNQDDCKGAEVTVHYLAS